MNTYKINNSLPPNKGIKKSARFQRLWEKLKAGQQRYLQEWRTQKLASSVLIASLVFLLGGTATIGYWIVRSLLIQNLKENALKEVQIASSEVDEWLASLRSQVESMANNSAVRSMNWSVAEPYLQLELDRLPDYRGFTLVYPDGSSYTTALRNAKGNNLKDRIQFQRALAGETNISDLLISRSTGTRQVSMATPIWAMPPLNRSQLSAEQAAIRTQSLKSLNFTVDPLEKPKIIGVLNAPVPVDHVTEVVEKISNSGKNLYAFALDSKGVPIAYPERRILQEAKSFLDSGNPTLAALTKAMINRKQGVDLLQLEGKWVYVAYTPVKTANWSLALVISRDNLERQLGALNLLAMVVGSLLILATLIAIGLLRLFEETRDRAAREALLNRLTERIRASLDLATILQTTVDEVAAWVRLDFVAFGWYKTDERRLEIICQSQQEMQPQQLEWLDTASLGDLSDRLLRGEMVRFNNIAKDSNLGKSIKEAYLQKGIKSYLALPVSVEDDLPGYLICIDATPRKEREGEKKLLRGVIDQLAIAITQARLYEEREEKIELLNQTLVKRQLAEIALQRSEAQLREKATQLETTLHDLKRTQTQIVQSEKMSSLGQLVAGVAHEINNPVSFIYGNLTHAADYTRDLLNLLDLYQQHYPNPALEIQDTIEEVDLNFIREDLPNLLGSMKVGSDRIKQIVLSLRNFSRMDESEMKEVNIHEGIDSTLTILQHRLKSKPGYPEIQVIKEYGNLPPVECYPGQLNQVFINILTNAIDALETDQIHLATKQMQPHPAIIRIRTQVLDANWVNIRIIDSGTGMSEETQRRIFDPFFTTKPVGQGTGLGLSISYQIVTERHGGVLECISAPGEGTEFAIQIPIQQK